MTLPSLRTLLLPLILAASIPAIAHGADVDAGAPATPGVADCAPFGCALRYQQAYDSSLFSGPINIVGLKFYNLVAAPGNITATDYTVRLSTGGRQVGALSGVFADNLGSRVETFFSGPLSGLAAFTFTISGAGFAYDPSEGDLLLDVTKSGGANALSVFNDARDPFSGFQRVFSFESLVRGDVTNNYGLVTTFIDGGAGVPEPATWAMMIIGFGAAGSMIRRRKAVVV